MRKSKKFLCNKQLTPAAKIAVLCASMKATTKCLNELSQVCSKIGEEGLAREALMIAVALDQRQAALAVILDQAHK